MLKIIKILMTVIIFWLLLNHAQLKLELLNKIMLFPLVTIYVVLLCYFLVLLHAWRWYRLNYAQGISLNFFQTIMPTYLGNAFNAILPSSIGGDFVRFYLVIKKFPHKKTSVAISILADRISGSLGVMAIACMTSLYYLETYHESVSIKNVAVTCVYLSIISICMCLLFSLFLSNNIVTYLKKSRLGEMVKSSIDALCLYKNSKLILFESLIVSILNQFVLLAAILLICGMMGLPKLSSTDFMLALIVGQLGSLIPLTPGGAGTGEAGFASTLLILHPDSAAGYATVFLALRIISSIAYIPGIIYGILGAQLLNNKLVISAEKL